MCEGPGPLDPLVAVVIPAYRAHYFRETLAAFAAQPNRRIRIYVADDNSPEPIREIAAEFADKLELVYHRFPENLGRTSLVRHWDRAIRLSREPWVWLFSDDDLVRPGCMDALLADLQRDPDPWKLRRFDLEFIDDQSRVTETEPPFPDSLGGVDYANQLLTSLAPTCVVQNIVFSRSLYDYENGFDDFPGGYCSDCATWPRFARHGGLRCVHATVGFRRHGEALSSTLLQNSPDWTVFIGCYGATIRAIRRSLGSDPISDRPHKLRELNWFTRWFRFLPRKLTPAERRTVAAELRDLWPDLAWSRRQYFHLNYTASRLRRNRWGYQLLQFRRDLTSRWNGAQDTR